MEKRILEGLVFRGLSTWAIAREVEKSQAAVRYWLHKYGLKTNPRKKSLRCPTCGETRRDRFYRPRGRCKTCHSQRQVSRIREAKRRAVAYKGGRCQVCGYSKNMAALDFHHRDPSQKDINFRTSRNWRWQRLRAELDKCDLVCKNCHAEIHYPDSG